MKKVSLKYGNQKINFEVPVIADILKITDPEYSIDKNKFILDLKAVLPENSMRYSNVGIVVSDKTRLCGYPEFLPWLLSVLHEKGAENENIRFYIAYGTHPRQTEEESEKSYGEVYRNYEFIHHDCYDEKAFTQLGLTERGTPVKIREDVLNSSLIITFGAISHHYFAGYGGGRKLLFPGLADRKSVYKNHSLFLDRESKQLAEGCQPGNLAGNPVAEDLYEIDDHMPPKVSVHGILNSEGKVVELRVGNNQAGFEAACKRHDSFYRSGSRELYDLVIASSGGYPKDINFIQVHKSIHNAAAFVKDGGELVVLCECIDKIASKYFLQYMETGSFREAFRMLEANYEGNGGTALSMMTKTRRIRIYMKTSLDESLCNTLGVQKIDENGIRGLLKKEDQKIAIIENASMLVR